MLLCYTAGPYRDTRGTRFVEENIRRAEEVALQLWSWGYAVITPHANTRHFDGYCGDRVWLEGDFEMIRRCDFLVALPRWETSSGTKEEILHATLCHVPICFWEHAGIQDSLREFTHDYRQRI